MKKQFKEKSVVMMVHDNRIDRRVLDEARSLQNAGWDVVVIAGPRPSPDYVWDENCYPDIKIIRIDLNKKVQPRKFKRTIPQNNIGWGEIFWLHDYFIDIAFDYPAQVYVAHDLPQLPAAMILAEEYQSYIVYDSHELYPEQYSFDKIKHDLYVEIEDSFMQWIDQVITVNKSFAKYISIRYRVELPEVILNCPAINSDNLPVPKNNVLREELDIPANKKILLYQGGVARYDNDIRNLEKLMLSMQFVRNDNIALVYMGPGGYKYEELLELAEEKGLLNKKFWYHEAVPQDKLLYYTASADAGIIPYPHIDFNTYFCTPNKLFEFIIAGLPILSNYSPELNDFITSQGIGENRNMLTPEGIAEIIEAFFDKNISNYTANINAISKNYVWDRQGDKLLEIYNSMLSEPPKSVEHDSKCHKILNDYIGTGKYNLAKKYCRQQLAGNPRDRVITNLLILAEFRSGNFSAAENILCDLLLNDPFDETALNNLNFISESLYRTNLSAKVKKELDDYCYENQNRR